MQMTLAANSSIDQTPERSRFVPATVLLIAFFVNALLWSFVILPFWGPDEGSHYEVVRYIATHRALPVYGQTYYVYDPSRLQVHASQPPLYYLLLTPIYEALSGTSQQWQVIGLRLLSIILGAATVGLLYVLACQLAPKRHDLAFATAAFVGFMPMFTYMSAVINSDNLNNFIYLVWLNLLIFGFRHTPSRGWLIGLGLILGLGLLTKYSIVPAFAISAIALLYLAYRQGNSLIRSTLTYGLWIGGTVLLISGWMFVRNWVTYGDLLDVGRVDINEWHAYAQIGSIGEMLTATAPPLPPFMFTLYQSFVGVFDYMEGYLPSPIYILFGGIVFVGLIGAVLAIIRLWLHRHKGSAGQHLFQASCFIGLGAATFFFVANYSYRMDYQPQGRYLFGALAPFALGVVIGWDRLFSALHLPRIAAPLLVILIVGINVLALFTTLVPLEHNRYLRSVSTNAKYAPQTLKETSSIDIPFVSQHAQVLELGVMLNVPANYTGTLEWKLKRGNTLLAYTDAHIDGVGLGFYKTQLPANLTLQPGSAYILAIKSMGSSSITPSIYALQGTQLNLPSTSDIGLQTTYPLGPNIATLQRLLYGLRSAPLTAERTIAQFFLYPIALICLGLIIFSAVSSLRTSKRFWKVALFIIILAFSVCIFQSGTSNIMVPHYDLPALIHP